jgi:hypothetical protein
MIEKQETARAWWPGSSLKEYTDALQELSDKLKKESEHWPFPTHPLKPWTKQQEKEYQEQQRSKLPDAPL